jgi:hypothetical protein
MIQVLYVKFYQSLIKDWEVTRRIKFMLCNKLILIGL